MPHQLHFGLLLYLRTVLPSALSKCVLYGSSPAMVCTAVLNLVVGLAHVGFSIPLVVHRLLICTQRKTYPSCATDYAFLLHAAIL